MRKLGNSQTIFYLHFVTFISSTGISKRVLREDPFSRKTGSKIRTDLHEDRLFIQRSDILRAPKQSCIADQSLIMLLFMQSAFTEPSREIMQIAAESRKQTKMSYTP